MPFSSLVIPQDKVKILHETFKSFIPAGWDFIAHHYTISFFGEIPEFLTSVKVKIVEGFQYNIICDAIGVSDEAIALRVKYSEILPADGRVAHITLAIPKGGQAKKSNEIKNWIKLKNGNCGDFHVLNGKFSK